MKKQYKCPNCERILKSKAGLTMHMNGMHLTLSSSQIEQMEKYEQKRDIKANMIIQEPFVDLEKLNRSIQGRKFNTIIQDESVNLENLNKVKKKKHERQ